MIRPVLLVCLIFAAGCSRKAAANYKKCLTLRVGMTREQVMTAMGEPDETAPYVDGKSLPHMKGRTAYEWATPASMPAPCRVVIDDATSLVATIRCADASITASTYVEPPED